MLKFKYLVLAIAITVALLGSGVAMAQCNRPITTVDTPWVAESIQPAATATVTSTVEITASDFEGMPVEDVPPMEREEL